MRPRTRAAGAMLAAAVLIGPSVLAGTAAAAPNAPNAPNAPAASAALPGATAFGAHAATPVSVTLITGDTVTVSGPDRFSVRRGKGRDAVTFMTERADGHLSVVPSDALPLLAAGRLDGRLFDVTTLISFGYDDRRDNLPLIVMGADAGARGAASARPGISGTRTVPGGTALRAAKAELSSVWPALAAGVSAPAANARAGSGTKIWLDGLRKPTLTESVPQIGAPTAWAAGFDGAGVTVAVVDTGVDTSHPDLAGRVAAAENFTDDEDTLDRVGHGTHVAATIGSSGAAPGGYTGVAPGSSLISAKVCVDYGCEESWMLAGMQWAAEQGAKVINVSIGGFDTPEQDPVEAAVERITAEFGALFVISAGNDGGDETVNSPGSADAALTVGAVDKAENLAPFSSRGPRTGDLAIKPDISAPGVDIVAANSKDGFLGVPGQSHLTLSGTSMAAPHVAGSAAILAQRHPTWTPAQLKAALMGSAKPNPAIDVFAQGAGRVDVARAVTRTVLADPPSVSFGRQLWPHDDDTPDARTVTYRNTGTADVTLALSIDGDPPAGLFSLSATSVTVPAGGTASVTLTSDTRADVPDTRHSGRLLATAGGGTAGESTVVTPFAVDKEVESHDLTIRRIADDGGTRSSGLTVLINQVTGQPFTVRGEAPEATVRVPKGTYTAAGFVLSGGEADFRNALVVDATVVIDRATTVTMDARKAKPVTVTLPKTDAVGVVANVDAVIAGENWGFAIGLLGNDFTGMSVGQTEPGERFAGLSHVVAGQFVKGPLPAEGPLPPSPYAYLLTYTGGQVPTGYTKRVTDRELATVHTSFATQGVPTAQTLAFGVTGVGGAWATTLPVTLPGGRVDHFSTAAGVEWDRQFVEGGFENLQAIQSAAPRTFQAGRAYRDAVNRAVFGPGFSADGFDVARLGDQMQVAPPMFSAAGDWAGSAQATGRTVVERDGQVIADVPAVGTFLPAVPAGDAAFRVRVDAERGAPNTLSTKVSGEWTFRSGTVAGDEPRNLALSAVRFAPPVDDRNTARANALWVVPVEIARQPDSAAAAARSLTVEVSVDDGATWKRVPVLRLGQHALIVVHNPAAGFVSLRAGSTDAAGNTVRQTVIRAYAVG